MRHIEHEEQVALFRHAAYRKFGDGTVRDYLYSIPNELPFHGKTAMLAMLRLKAAGLTPGIPDVVCFALSPVNPQFRGLYIEMKKPLGVPSDVKPKQKDVMKKLTSCGYKCVVAFGEQQAWTEICHYLGIKS